MCVCVCIGCAKSEAVLAVSTACWQDGGVGRIRCQRVSSAAVYTQGNMSHHPVAVRCVVCFAIIVIITP